MTPDASFRAFRKFNDPKHHWLVGFGHLVNHKLLPYFDTPQMPDKIVRALIAHRAIPIKEVFESFEFFERVRRRIRNRVVYDLCCGHGLVGMLFALFEPKVEVVYLVDNKKPDNHTLTLKAIEEVAPWAIPKIRYLVRPISALHILNPEGFQEDDPTYPPEHVSIVGVHACAHRTDSCIRLAVAHKCSLAVMPCCYKRTAKTAPLAIKKAIGAILTTDIHRTYTLVAAGYTVDWSAVPKAITPMNRIILASVL